MVLALTDKSKWNVWCPHFGIERDEAYIVQALDAEDAAEEFAAEFDRDGCDYVFLEGSSAEVFVEDGDKIRTFNVSGETVPHYHATEKEQA